VGGGTVRRRGWQVGDGQWAGLEGGASREEEWSSGGGGRGVGHREEEDEEWVTGRRRPTGSCTPPIGGVHLGGHAK
jgi:hypothetical protein